MLFNDQQKDVDAFIVKEDPLVPRTQHPLKATGIMETIYTRLRNELAHTRVGTNIEATKTQMAHRVGGLVSLVKRCIEQQP
jgi:hypothetical protein